MHKIGLTVVALSLAASGSLFAQTAPARPAPASAPCPQPTAPRDAKAPCPEAAPEKTSISTGQDFNTTRSNRERSNFLANNPNTGRTGPNTDRTARSKTGLPKQEAQDFNTTRSNRERSNF